MEEFLLNPNFAYLLIVAGFLLTVFAVITPGTGIFELGALFILLFVGWQIYNIPINLWALILLGLGIVPFILALRRQREALNLGLTALAFVIGSAFIFRSDDWWRPVVHPVLAVVVSILAGGFFWLMTTKVLEARAKDVAHDLEGLIGAIGEARTAVHAEGSVDKPIKVGARVKVLSREGFSLHVEKTKEESKS
jgi:membrane-bound serine protease (ClpP class)